MGVIFGHTHPALLSISVLQFTDCQMVLSFRLICIQDKRCVLIFDLGPRLMVELFRYLVLRVCWFHSAIWHHFLSIVPPRIVNDTPNLTLFAVGVATAPFIGNTKVYLFFTVYRLTDPPTHLQPVPHVVTHLPRFARTSGDKRLSVERQLALVE